MDKKISTENITISYLDDDRAKTEFLNLIINYMLDSDFLKKDGVNERK